MIRLPPRATLFPSTRLVRSSASSSGSTRSARSLRLSSGAPPSGSAEAATSSAAASDSFTARVNIPPRPVHRSEEHTSELQPRHYLVCRLLLAKRLNSHLQLP